MLLSNLVAGAYPLHRPPNAWSPGVSVPRGPFYWLLASGSPMGWLGGFLAAGLMRDGLHHYYLGGCSALLVCTRRFWMVRGGRRRSWFPVSSPPSLVPPAVRVAGCPFWVSLVLGCWYAIPDGLRVPRASSGCPSGARRVTVVWLCTCAPTVFASPPTCSVARAPRKVPCGAPAGPSQVVLAPPRFPPEFYAPLA